MIKIAQVEFEDIGLKIYKKNTINAVTDIYWYDKDITPEELNQEIIDLQEFYDIVIIPYKEDKDGQRKCDF